MTRSAAELAPVGVTRSAAEPAPVAAGGSLAWGTQAVTSEDELREIVGDPSPLVLGKVIDHVDEQARGFIAGSPLCLLATRSRDGVLDVSPRGDPPGSVLVAEDGASLVLADRRGNRRVDSFRNILDDPHVGMLFVVPGVGETLRVNGRATLVRDGPFFDRMVVRGARPQLAVVVDVHEVFVHCAKAFLRSSLWKPESWPEAGAVPSAARMLKAHAGITVSEAQLHDDLQTGYRLHQY